MQGRESSEQTDRPNHPKRQVPASDRSEMLRSFCVRMERRFAGEGWARRMRGYRQRPEAFAAQVLGVRWWSKQRAVAEEVARSRRVAVKSANGVGKTFLAADLALWFLYTHQPSIVLTTAPTWRQVRHLLWEEMRRQFRSARTPLPGSLLATRISAGDGWFALGLATDDPVKFQGFHAENLLVIFDEASGIPEEIWDAAEGVAVGENNRILAIGNPLSTSGRFYKLFRDAASSGWRRQTISALDHPNVTGAEPSISGAVTPTAIDERVAEWCEEEGVRCSVFGAGPDTEHQTPNTDSFEWRGVRYRPNDLFRSRVLGEFPEADAEGLIPLRWVEAAMARDRGSDDLRGCRRMAADVARFGGDSTVIGLRVGPTLVRLEAFTGADLMAVTGRIVAMAREERPESIAVDAIGLGAGVVDRLREIGLAGVEAVNVALPAYDTERFANRRAEIYWGLRERFRTGDIALPRDEALAEQLAALRYTLDSRGRIQIESKEKMKGRGLKSPDRADMAALLFDGPGEGALSPGSGAGGAAPAQRLREEMAGW